LMAAVVHLQAGSVRQLLAHGSNASAIDSEGWQALHAACGSLAAKAPQIAIDMVVQLLAAGTDVNAPATAGAIAPLANAVQFGHPEIVRLLLKAGADPDAAIADGMTCLMFAAQTKQSDKLAALLEAGAAVDRARPGGDTALMLAASSGNAAGLLALLKAGAAVNAANDEGVTSLMYASGLEPGAQDGDGCQLVDALLAAGASVAAADNTGRTALMFAATSGGVAAVRSLLQAGAAVNTAAADGSMCLIAACGRWCCDDQCSAAAAPVVLQLLAAGDDVNASAQGFSALMAAANAGSVKGVEALLKAGAAVNAASPTGDTALYRAVDPYKCSGPQHRYDQVVAQLLNAGANASAAWHGQVGVTPLHAAASYGKYNIMRQLLAAGAQCEARETYGELHCATYASVDALYPTVM
jgi:ankyrin repeat protein